mgnify:CR=1 FL=1
MKLNDYNFKSMTKNPMMKLTEHIDMKGRYI